MSDRAALLTAIVANPDEDTPRLVYADWLDEHGESKRAAHIRAQIECHRLGTADTALAAVDDFLASQYEEGLARIDWGAVDADLGARVAAHKAHDKHPFKLNARAEGLPRVKGVTYGNDERGFFDAALVDDASAFLRHAGAIFRAAPIARVDFDGLTGEQAAEFTASGHLARVRRIGFRDNIDPDAVRAIGTHRDAAGVRKLEIESYDWAGDVVDALAAGGHWNGLKSLCVSDLEGEDAPLEEGGMARLFARPQFRNLRALIAWSSGVDDAAVRAIVKNMPELRELDLAMNPLNDGLGLIAAARNLRHLRALDLSACDLEGTDPAPLIAAPNLPNLTVLQLDGNSLEGPDPKALAKSGRGPGLRVLDLGDSNFSAAGVEALARCPALHGVWHLTLDTTGLDDDALEGFTRSAPFERLTYLDLSNNHITARGMKALAAWPGCAGLQWLNLADNVMGESGAKALAAGPHLAGLKYLHATGRGCVHLKKRFKKVFV
ncbi:MAG: TIGR02996 domain-containing protein [Planctomycetes bacterium]|nr:TIGR02996 domain-containing protein [Planctomycetota bacterium]